jgi:hypothetical protein
VGGGVGHLVEGDQAESGGRRPRAVAGAGEGVAGLVVARVQLSVDDAAVLATCAAVFGTSAPVNRPPVGMPSAMNGP